MKINNKSLNSFKIILSVLKNIPLLILGIVFITLEKTGYITILNPGKRVPTPSLILTILYALLVYTFCNFTPVVGLFKSVGIPFIIIPILFSWFIAWSLSLFTKTPPIKKIFQITSVIVLALCSFVFLIGLVALYWLGQEF